MKTQNKIWSLCVSTMIFFLISVSVFADRGVSEDFQKYTTSLKNTVTYDQIINGFNTTLFMEEGNGVYGCSNPAAFPYCVTNNTPYYISRAGYGVLNEQGNKFLRIFAVGGTDTDYQRTLIYFNWSNISTLQNVSANSTYTLQFFFRLYQSDYTTYIAYNNLENTFAGIVLPMNALIRSGSGGIKATPFSNYTAWRTYKSGTSEMPLNSNCSLKYVPNGDWDFLSINYHTGADCGLRYIETYLNGDLCQNESYVTASVCGKYWYYGSNYSFFNIEAYKSFAFDVDNIAWYDNIQDPTPDYATLQGFPEITDMNCPVTGCIFYDDYTYTAGYDLSLNGYDINTDAAYFNNSFMYLNSSMTNPSINHSLNTDSYDYVTAVYKFNVANIDPTPSTLTDAYIIYAFADTCSNEWLDFYKVYFIRDDSYTNSENRTAINVYVKNDNVMKLIKTVTVENGESIYIIRKFDYSQNKILISVVPQNIISDGYDPYNPEFNIDVLQSCRQDGFTVYRLDLNNPVDEYNFIGIDKIYYFGENYATSGSFEYGTAITQNQSLIKSDWSENIKNFAFSMGFKTSVSLLILCVIIIIASISIISKTNLPSNGKMIGIVAIIPLLFLILYRIGFMPLTVLIMVLLIFAIVGGYLFVAWIKGNSTSGE